MGKNKKEKAKISFVGMSSEDVTGSMHLVTYKKKNILLDCGMYQCKDKIKQWNINSRNLKFKVKELDVIIVLHQHLDHYGGLAHLYEIGCEATIYAPKHMREYLKIAYEDGLKIHNSDLDYVNKRTGKNHKPLYTKESIDKMLSKIVEVDFNEKAGINEFMYIRMTPAYHIIFSAQLELFIRDEQSNYRKKIYYSSDLGNIRINKPFLNGFTKVENADVAIIESTYAMNNKRCDEKTRAKDIEKIETILRETCIESDGKLVFASFAMQRAQEILFELHRIWERERFDTPIILDSPLAVKITNHFANMCEGENKVIIDKIMNWKNLKLISEWKDSELVQNSKESAIVVACSGFGEAGRIRSWFKKELPREQSRIVFIGYSSDESLSGIIKSGRKKYIKIDGDDVLNKARVTNLLSFSSHIQHKDMLKLYSDMNVNQIYLVHSDMSKRLEFAQLLEDEYRKKCKTTNVYVGMKDTTVEV